MRRLGDRFRRSRLGRRLASEPASRSLIGFTALVVTGFVAIHLAWRGTARTLVLREQLPQLISGGIGGVALVATGVAFIAVQLARRDAAAEDAVAERLTTQAIELFERVHRETPVVSQPEVLAGRTTYHRPGCRAVRSQLPQRPLADAEASGLRPCRTCIRSVDRKEA